METNDQKKCNQTLGIKGYIWCDDHCDVYVGNCKTLSRKVLEQNIDPQESRKSTQLGVKATCGDFLYFVCWNNDRGENGFLAELKGSNIVRSGDNHNWQVFPTGIDFDFRNPRPTKELVEEQLKIAHCKGWKKVFVGPQNLDGSAATTPFSEKSNISKEARFIWYNSGNDSRALYPSSPFVPFRVPPTPGFNHDEFLIFRLPVKDLHRESCQGCPPVECECACNCGCNGCNHEAEEQNQELINRARGKFNTESSSSNPNCLPPFSGRCDVSALNGQINLEPCFHFHWGDSATDQFEEHDTEVFYLTVCNPFKDIQYKGLRITKVTLIPSHSLDKIQIVPDRFICLDCLDPCSCQTREFAMITRSDTIAGNYRLHVEYCYEEIVLASGAGSGKVDFPVVITED